MLVKRKIIEIDESLCNGCGQCVLDCAEGAIKIVDGKARLISDNLCDGLGACMGGCPVDALKIIEREACNFDEEAVEKHLKENKRPSLSVGKPLCPSLKMSKPGLNEGALNWPVQISLIPVDSTIFENGELLIAADCVSAVSKNFHDEIVNGKKLMIGCPKLDNPGEYIDKFEYIFKNNNLSSLTLAKMEVPCCSGMLSILRESIKRSKRKIDLNVITISRAGEIIENKKNL